MNAARVFINSVSDLRTFIGNASWGKDLKGQLVTNRATFLSAIADLRTPNGKNPSASWANPVRWNDIFNGYNVISQAIYGSDEKTITNLASININTLIVDTIGCSSGGSSTQIVFQSMNLSDPVYWNERWELYKYSYASAVWAWYKGVNMIEFYNEPDTQLGSCLTADRFKDYYFLRSISIQHAYSDINNLNAKKINISIIASAFAKRTYGGNSTQYLGDLCVQNRNYMFDLGENQTNWTNMHFYSYHTYGKTGSSMLTDLQYLTQSVNNDTNFVSVIPVVITEHNSHTSSSWDTVATTPDDDLEASRLASQIMFTIYANITAEYVFKFSITQSSIAGQAIAKNGLHWGELINDPFDISDTTLSAEAMRLLTVIKQSIVYPVLSNDTSIYRTYLGSKSPDGSHYFHVVNDKSDYVNILLDMSKWNLTVGLPVIIELVGNGYWGEVISITKVPVYGSLLTFSIIPYSTARLSIASTSQNVTTSVTTSCTVSAGALSSLSDCNNASLLAGTSSTLQHENTSIILMQFSLNKSISRDQKSILKVYVEQVIGGNDITVVVLGLLNPNSIWNTTSATWNSLSNSLYGLNILTPLSSNWLINNTSANFINWRSTSNITVVGHITASGNTLNTIKMIDVTEYVSNALLAGVTNITFLLYRPFRYISYPTTAGVLPADTLSNGSRIKISSKNSANPAQLIHFASALVDNATTTTITAASNITTQTTTPVIYTSANVNIITSTTILNTFTNSFKLISLTNSSAPNNTETTTQAAPMTSSTSQRYIAKISVLNKYLTLLALIISLTIF